MTPPQAKSLRKFWCVLTIARWWAKTNFQNDYEILQKRARGIL